MRRLTHSEFIAAQEALSGPESEQLYLSVFDLALGRQPRGGDKIIFKLAELAWYVNGDFTELGQLIRDPLREYGFWLERDGQLPSEDCVPVLKRCRFKGKRLLELGSGGGCNLLSLTAIPEKLTGLEPMPVYLQMTPILAQMAELPEPEVIEAGAESIPLVSGSYDVLVCYSSHQYMDINKALSEMARILSPGGELIIIGNSLHPFVLESVLGFFRSWDLGRAKFNAIAIINTCFYQLFGERLIYDASGTTASPIYPTRGHMLRRLKNEGLSWNKGDTYVVGSGETVLVANKIKGE
jgi:SAM-dependent methyltransferase